MNIEDKYDWSRLTHLQLGKYAEYYAKMEFTLHGFDVYTAEVDDKGIDFVIRKDGKYYDVQVKSVRGYQYVFFPKSKFLLRKNLLATVLIFLPGAAPRIFLIPSEVWEVPKPPFTSMDYEGKKSAPEWGINVSKKNDAVLDAFIFDKVVSTLI